MICSVGFDLVDINRIERLMHNERFMERVYSEYERGYICRPGRGAKSAAGIFAAKEAFSKAFGTGLSGFSLQEVEVRHNEYGAPEFIFNGQLLDELTKRGLVFNLSITHTEAAAGAVVISLPVK